MTYTKKQVLPALHNSSKVPNPDLNEIGEKNYTSTILKYAGLAVKFAQLDTKAKTIVPAINEVRVIPNPTVDEYYITTEDGYFITTEDSEIIVGNGSGGSGPALRTVKINGTVYRIEGGSGASALDDLTDVDIDNPTTGQALVYDETEGKWVNREGGGGDYTAGYGIYLTGDNNSIINADAGRLYRTSQKFTFSTDYGPSEGSTVPCWEDSGTTVDDHTVYQTRGGTYKEPSGDSLCTFTVSGYSDFTVYAKQNPNTSSFRYIVFGSKNEEIDLEHDSGYDSICRYWTDSGYIQHEYSLGGESCTVQLMYHKDPFIQGISVDLNNGQFVDTGTTVDDHPVYKSDAGSYHIDSGVSLCTLTISGVTSFTIYFRTSSEYNYDWAYVGYLDEEVSKTYYKSRLSGTPSYTAVTFECSPDKHTLEIMYAKDGSFDYGDDRAYFYSVVNEYGPIPTDDDRAYAFVVLGTPYVGGEYFNDYAYNKAIGVFSHAEGQNTQSLANGSHAEGYGTKAQGPYSHAEGHGNTTNGDYSHAEGHDNTTHGTGSHAEGSRNVVVGQNSHVEGMDNQTGEQCAHAEGASTKALGAQSHAEGWGTLAKGPNSHAEGKETQALEWRSHAEGTQSIASGDTSHAEGWKTEARGGQDHSEGYHTIAEGGSSHAEGHYTHTTGGNSHAEGSYTVASGSSSHAEGFGDSTTQVISSGQGSHAEGGFTSATADFAHAEGRFTIASGAGSHAEGFGGYGGQYNTATGIAAHAEGSGNLVSGNCGHAEGTRNTVYSESGHADGSGNQVYGRESHATGSGNTVSEQSGYVEGAGNRNIAYSAHVEGGGNRNTYKANISHTEGAGNTNYGYQAHAEGSGNRLSGEEAHVEGAGNMVHGAKTHGEGGGNIAYGMGSHIEGKHNLLVGFGNHAEGISNHIGFAGTPGYFSYGTTYALGDIVGVNDVYRPTTSPEEASSYLFYCTTAPGQIQASDNVNIVTPDEWNSSTTYGLGSVVRVSGIGFYYNPNQVSTNENPALGGPWWKITNILSPFKSSGSGYYMLDADEASGANKVAVVYSDTVAPMWTPIASPKGGHVEGIGNVSVGDYQHVQGKYNVNDYSKAFIIGNGEDDAHRSNAFTVDWSGNTVIAGDLTTGVALSTTAQTIGAAINELAAGGGGGGSTTPIPDTFIYSLFS